MGTFIIVVFVMAGVVILFTGDFEDIIDHIFTIIIIAIIITFMIKLFVSWLEPHDTNFEAEAPTLEQIAKEVKYPINFEEFRAVCERIANEHPFVVNKKDGIISCNIDLKNLILEKKAQPVPLD